MTVASRWCGITDKLQTTDGRTDMQATWLSIRKHSEPPSNLSDHETSKIIRVRWLGDRTASKTGITSSRCLLGGHFWSNGKSLRPMCPQTMSSLWAGTHPGMHWESFPFPQEVTPFEEWVRPRAYVRDTQLNMELRLRSLLSESYLASLPSPPSLNKPRPII